MQKTSNMYKTLHYEYNTTHTFCYTQQLDAIICIMTGVRRKDVGISVMNIVVFSNKDVITQENTQTYFVSTVLCKSFDPPLISVKFASREPEVVLRNRFPNLFKLFQGF